MTNDFERPSIQLSPLGGETAISDFVSRAKQLEAGGWAGVWIGEVGFDPFAILGLVAANTSRLQIGTSIATWTRSVPTMAACAATLDRISNGRFRLGLGTMPRAWNEDWHGIDTSRMVRRMQEYIQAIRVAWKAHSGQAVSYEGEILHLRNYSQMWRPVREALPIFLAGSGRKWFDLRAAWPTGSSYIRFSRLARCANMCCRSSAKPRCVRGANPATWNPR